MVKPELSLLRVEPAKPRVSKSYPHSRCIPKESSVTIFASLLSLLPTSCSGVTRPGQFERRRPLQLQKRIQFPIGTDAKNQVGLKLVQELGRSEERRVGKEGRSR